MSLEKLLEASGYEPIVEESVSFEPVGEFPPLGTMKIEIVDGQPVVSISGMIANTSPDEYLEKLAENVADRVGIPLSELTKEVQK